MTGKGAETQGTLDKFVEAQTAGKQTHPTNNKHGEDNQSNEEEGKPTNSSRPHYTTNRWKQSYSIWNKLTIWQQNMNKSQMSQHDLISSGKLINSGIDIVAIQEPSIKFLDLTVTSRGWIPLYPLTHEKNQKKTWVITLVSSKLPTKSWNKSNFNWKMWQWSRSWAHGDR